jgi:hypothetical protein
MVTFENFIEGWDIAKAEMVKAWLIQNIGPQLEKVKGYESVGSGWSLDATPPGFLKKNHTLDIVAPLWILSIEDDALALQFKLTWL